MNRKVRTYIIGFVSVVIFSIAISILLLHYEKGYPGTSIHDFEDAFWYMLVSLTSVGYGDITPVSGGGKVIGYFYVVASLVVIGVLIGSFSTNIMNMMEDKKLGFSGTRFEDHVIFIGWNDFSKNVADEVFETEKKIAIVTDNKDDIDLIYEHYGKKKVFVLYNDFHNFEALEKVNAHNAADIFVSFDDDTESLLYLIEFKKMYPEPEIIVSLENSNLEDTFHAAGVKYVVARNEIASLLVASYIFEPDVAEFNLDVLSHAKDDNDYDNQEYKVILENPYINKNCLDTFIDLKQKYNCVLLGISKNVGKDEWTLVSNPTQSVTVELNDYLIVMCNKSTKEQIEEVFKINEGRI